MNINKAEKVEAAYDEAQYENYSSESCYTFAVDTARELGGIDIANSNDGNRSKSFAPTITFEFDDLSTAQVTYGGVWL